MLIEGTTVTVPGPKPGEPDIVLELKDILIAESRQREVAIVTPMKAPELLSLFNEAWRNVDKLVKRLVEAQNRADHMVERRRAKLLLEHVEGVLKAANLSSTKDTRDAVITLDDEFQAAQDRVDQIQAAAEYLKGLQKSFENAFTSVKKIMGEDAFNMANRIGNKNLSHGSEPNENPKPTTSGYGKSRY
jgi:hypothetical protein